MLVLINFGFNFFHFQGLQVSVVQVGAFLLMVSKIIFDYWVIFHAFLSSADFFSKWTFLINSFRNTIRVSNSLLPDQAQHYVGPDLGPNCLQRLSPINSYKSI